MNLPNRITLLGMLTVQFLATLWSATGRAQQEGKTVQLLIMYQRCVFDAVRSQVKNSGSAIDPSAATEVAFQACRTEEQAIFAQASAGGVPPSQANQVIIDYKLSIKQQVRKIYANAEKTAVQPAARQAPSAPAVDRPPPRPGCGGAYRRYDGEWTYINCN